MDVLWLRTGYLEFPLLVKGLIPLGERLTSHIGKKIRPYVAMGPELSVLLSAELEGIDLEPTSIKETTTAIDLGICFAVGVAVTLPKRSTLIIEGRYDIGLNSIDDNGDGDDIKNRVFSLMLGYQLPLDVLSGRTDATAPQ
jgi:hypothetical protein